MELFIAENSASESLLLTPTSSNRSSSEITVISRNKPFVAPLTWKQSFLLDSKMSVLIQA